MVTAPESTLSGTRKPPPRASARLKPVKKKDLVDFAARPWQVIGEGDDEHWRARKRELGPAEGMRIAAELRALVVAERPDWPGAADREADLAVHARVSEGLRRVAASCAP